MKKSHMPKSSETAAELMARLRDDPAYSARLALRKEQEHKRQHELELAERPVLEGLRAVGYVVASLDQLRVSGTRYERAIPILLAQLTQVKDSRIKESIVRTLSVPWAAPIATGPLIEEFKSCSEHNLRWMIANALEVIVDDYHFDSICELALDSKYGKSREMLVLALGKMKNPLAVGVLIRLLQDTIVQGHAVIALGKLGDKKAIPFIETFVTHPNSWIRKEANKALKRCRSVKQNKI